MDLEWTEPAIADLAAIREYILASDGRARHPPREPSSRRESGKSKFESSHGTLRAEKIILRALTPV
jgi:hypothetical protein